MGLILQRFAHDGFFRQRLVETFCYEKVRWFGSNANFAFMKKWTSYITNIVAKSSLGISDFCILTVWQVLLMLIFFMNGVSINSDFRSSYISDFNFEAKLVVFINFDPKLHVPLLNLNFKKLFEDCKTLFILFGFVKPQAYDVSNVSLNLLEFLKFLVVLVLGGLYSWFCKIKVMQIVYDPVTIGEVTFSLIQKCLVEFTNRFGLLINFTPVSLFGGLR